MLLDADILTRAVGRKRLFILRRKIKRGNILCLLDFFLDHKVLEPFPSRTLVQYFLTEEEHTGELPIGSNPGVVKFAFEDVCAEYVRDCLQEVFANDSVLLRYDMQRRVFVADALYYRKDRCEVIDICGIGIDSPSQGFGLITPLQSL